MSIMAVARRYAEALADVTLARNQVEQVEAEIRTFTEMMQTSRELRDLFASPIISKDEKSRVLDALVDRVRPGQTTTNLLRLMLRHYRLHNLGAVYEQFRREMNNRQGVALAEVTTAAPIAVAEQEKLSGKLQQIVGKQVRLQFKTDPSLIGGVVTRIGSVVYDGSIRTQLRTIKQRMKEGDR